MLWKKPYDSSFSSGKYREIKIHVYSKRHKWICTTWRSFPFTLYCFYTKISSFFFASFNYRNRSDCFYLLISVYCEKFSTWIWRFPFAVNVILNLTIIHRITGNTSNRQSRIQSPSKIKTACTDTSFLKNHCKCLPVFRCDEIRDKITGTTTYSFILE